MSNVHMIKYGSYLSYPGMRIMFQLFNELSHKYTTITTSLYYNTPRAQPMHLTCDSLVCSGCHFVTFILLQQITVIILDKSCTES